MFYKTRIKNVTDYGAVDVNGRPLRFIGYLPVKAGDTVYTDGRVIFGNAPPKGAPAVFDEPSGIPVLGDDLRGYFTRNGIYKNYNIAQDDWITNSKKKFAHGEELFNSDEVIDADISDDNKKIIVTGGLYKKSRTLDTTNVAFWAKDTRIWGKRIPVYGPYVYEQILGSDVITDKFVPLHFFIDDSEQESVDLSLFADDVEARALLCAEKIMAQSYTSESSYPYVTPEEITQLEMDIFGYIRGVYASEGSINEVAKPRPAEPFIAYTAAYVLSSNSDAKGFSGIVFATTQGYCFPYIESRFFVNNLLNYGITHDVFIVNEIKAIREWKCVPFGFSCLYNVHDNKFEPLAARSFGGIASEIVAVDPDKGILVSNVAGSPSGYTADVLQHKTLSLISNFDTQELEELLPVGDGFYTMDKFGLLAFYNSNRIKIAEDIPVHNNFCYVEFNHAEFYFNQIRFNNTPDFLKYTVYTPDGNVEEKIFPLVDEDFYIVQRDDDGNIIGIIDERHDHRDKSFPPVDGYYIKQDDGILEPLHFTPLFYEFKNGSFLYGVKGGKLFLKTKDGIEQLVGDGLKNFRLRELKKISKAKQ